MIDGVINNGRKGEELEAAKGEARRTSPEKKLLIRERLEAAKKECGERKPPDKAHQEAPGARPMSRSKKWRLEWAFFLGRTAAASTTRSARAAPTPASRASGLSSSPVPITSPHAQKSAAIEVENGAKNRLWRLFRE